MEYVYRPGERQLPKAEHGAITTTQYSDYTAIHGLDYSIAVIFFKSLYGLFFVSFLRMIAGRLVWENQPGVPFLILQKSTSHPVDPVSLSPQRFCGESGRIDWGKRHF